MIKKSPNTSVKKVSNKHRYQGKQFIKYTWIVIIAWILILGGLFIREIYLQDNAMRELAILEGRTHFNKDKVFRYWSASHGGFYVPVSERTVPSKFLAHIPERDIITPSGKQLTLMNPAWALRQMNEDYSELFGVVGHITSLRPLRLENSPDNWEQKALELFANGETEVLEFIKSDSQQVMRLMQPLITVEGCLKCHEHQGYTVGDIRGGVSVSIPLDSFITVKHKVNNATILAFFLVGVFGLGVIILASRITQQNINKKDHLLNLLDESNKTLELKVKKRTMELNKVKNFLTAAMDQSTAGIAIADAPDGKLSYVNNAALGIHGGSAEEIVDGIGIDQYVDSWHILHLDGTPFAKDEVPLARALLYGETNNREFIIRRPNMEDRIVSASAAPILNKSGKIIAAIVVFTDITEQKEVEKKLEIHRWQLENILKNKTQELETFAYVLSNDLRAPLRAIKGITSALINDYSENFDKEGKRLGMMVEDNVSKMGMLIDGLLKFSHVGTKTLDLFKVDMKKMVYSMYYEVTNEEIRNKIYLTVDDIPAVNCDSTLMKYVWTNLLSNAIKYSSDRNIIKIYITSKIEDNKIIYSIRDNGIGFDVKNLDNLFSVFKRLHKDNEFAGAGIGLAMVQRIIERHNGEIWAESDVGKGATFSFSLPSKTILTLN